MTIPCGSCERPATFVCLGDGPAMPPHLKHRSHPSCDECDRGKGCRMVAGRSLEFMELARRAAESSEAENAKVAAMPHAEREAYIGAWARKMADRMVELGESELPI